jgi:hypothetical protein
MEGFAKESRNAQATPACNRSMTLATPISKLRGSSVAQSDGALTMDCSNISIHQSRYAAGIDVDLRGLR